MCLMYNAIKKYISDRRLRKQEVPLVRRKLAGNQKRPDREKLLTYI